MYLSHLWAEGHTGAMTAWLSRCGKSSKLFEVYTTFCHVPTLCPHLNQATKGQTWALNTARVSLNLHFSWQFVYWFAILQGIKTEGVWGCGACPVDHRRLWGWVWVIMSFHFHHRQFVYPHVVYSALQLATTEVMFSAWCSLIPRLSLSWTGAWEWSYKYTRRIL